MAEPNNKRIEPGQWHAEFHEDGSIKTIVYEPSFRKLLGYETEKEFINNENSWENAIHPDDMDRVTNHFNDVIKKHPGGMDFDIEYRLQTKWGYHWFHDVGVCERTPDGTLINMKGVVFDIEDIKMNDIRIKHQALLAEVLNYLINNNDDPIELLKQFAERIRALLNCDQVIYRDLEETRIMVNSKRIEDTWSVPIEYCKQCQHFNAHHPMYKGGYTEMNNCQKGWKGIPVYKKCPIKSSLTRIVYCDNEIAGYLAIHYVENYHIFNDIERFTVAEFARILSMSLSRFKARQENEELKLLQKYKEELTKNAEIIEALTASYSSVYYLDIESENLIPYSMDETTKAVMNKILNSSNNYVKTFNAYVEKFVYKADQQMVLKEGRLSNIIEKLRNKNSYKVNYRGHYEKDIVFCEMKIIKGRVENGEIKSVAVGFAHRNDEIMAQFINEKLVAEYISAFMVDLSKDEYRIYRRPETTKTMDRVDRCWSNAIRDFAKECDPAYQEIVKNIGSPSFLKKELADVDRREYLYRFPSASKPWRRAVIQVVDRINGVANYVVATFMGIDDYQSKIKDQEKQLEAQQYELKKAFAMADAANKAKTEFLFNMSHDIRTPMNAILGYTDIALNNETDQAKINDSLLKIKSSSSHLLNLINDILEMSRIEAGKFELINHPMDIREVVRNVSQMSESLALAKSIDFKTTIGIIKNPYIYSDELHINEVLINIISNAIKYTHKGGMVRYTVEQIVDVVDSYARFRLTITDNGIGMSKEFQKHLFENFARENNSTVSKQEGTGLGLAIAKRVIDLANGTITVMSQKGKGSTFIVELPCKVMDRIAVDEYKRKQENPDVFAGTRDLVGKRVLIVEDNVINREMAVEMLKEAGFVTDFAEDGAVAVRKVKLRGVNYYDFILMDIQMPNMNGYEATAAIRKLRNGDRVPIIALSANAFKEDVDRSLSYGMNAHVAKPINMEILMATMREHNK